VRRSCVKQATSFGALLAPAILLCDRVVKSSPGCLGKAITPKQSAELKTSCPHSCRIRVTFGQRVCTWGLASGSPAARRQTTSMRGK